MTRIYYCSSKSVSVVDAQIVEMVFGPIERRDDLEAVVSIVVEMWVIEKKKKGRVLVLEIILR